MKCLICSNKKDFTPLFPTFCSTKNYICNECGFVFIPNEESHSLQQYYKDNGYFKKSKNFGIRELFFSKRLYEYEGKKRLREICTLYKNIDLKNKKILDVGCGYGEILYILKKDFNCTVLGIEPSSRAAKVGRKNFGIEIKDILLEEFEEGNKFDVIICNHTLEHVEDPKNFLGKIYKLLKKDGYLYIEVPNILKPYFPLEVFLYNEHLINFSSYTLNKLLNLSGFKVSKYSDNTFLKFWCTKSLKSKDSKDPKNTIQTDKISKDNTINFLTEYKKKYGIKNYVSVYTQKFLYLVKIIYFKLLSFIYED